MQRDRFTSLVWGALALCLGLIQWQAWSRAQAELAVGTADMAWAAARAAGFFLILAALARAAWWTAGGHPVRWRRAGDGVVPETLRQRGVHL